MPISGCFGSFPRKSLFKDQRKAVRFEEAIRHQFGYGTASDFFPSFSNSVLIAPIQQGLPGTTMLMASTMLQKYPLYSSVVSISSKKSMKFILSMAMLYHAFRKLKRPVGVVFENWFRWAITRVLPPNSVIISHATPVTLTSTCNRFSLLFCAFSSVAVT